MKSKWTLVVLAALLVSTAAFAANVPVAKQQAPAGMVPTPHQNAASVLYRQDWLVGYGMASQNFEAAYNAYDCRAADDFVNSSTWNVTKITTWGFGSYGIAPSSFNLWILPDQAGHPNTSDGTALCTYLGATGTYNAGDYSMLFNLPTTCTLPAGHYWLVTQANMAFGSTGQWFWLTSGPPTMNLEDNWQENGGFGTTCVQPAWKYMCTGTNCICTGLGDFDMSLMLEDGGGTGGGGSTGGSCDLSPIEAKLDDGTRFTSDTELAAAVTTIMDGINALEAKADVIGPALASLEAKLDAQDACAIVRLILPYIKGADWTSTHPCWVTVPKAGVRTR